MKCPKCGYLGFETTDRCRNCGYDFSFAAPSLSSELPLRMPAADAPLEDLVLGALELEPPRAIDAHDRDAAGFGRPGPRTTPDYSTPPYSAGPAVAGPSRRTIRVNEPDDRQRRGAAAIRAATGWGAARGASGHQRRAASAPEYHAPRPHGGAGPAAGDGASRRACRRTPRPAGASPERRERGLWSRVAAAVIDGILLLSIDAGVMWLTLRIAGLQPTAEDLAIIRPVPMSTFFLVMAFLYLVGFTLGGGQTMGKMITGIRVTGDDGRGVDITGAVVRALGSLLAICTLGVLFIPILFSAERRALHDRLAGTRVVIG